MTNFAQQWLDIRGVRDIVPDPVLFPEYNPDLGDAFARELELFVGERVPRGPQRARAPERQAHVPERAARVALRRARRARRQFPPRRARRREPLGPVRQGRHPDGDVVPEPHGACAYAARGSSKSITGTPPAAPPPNVEAFPENQEGEQPKTVRERLEMHRANPTLQRLPRRHGPARLRAREFRRDRRVARQGSRNG